MARTESAPIESPRRRTDSRRRERDVAGRAQGQKKSLLGVAREPARNGALHLDRAVLQANEVRFSAASAMPLPDNPPHARIPRLA